MKKGKLSKILAIVLTLVMVVGIMSPISMLTTVAVENEEEPFYYAPTAFSKEMLSADGWVDTKNDGTTITTYDDRYGVGKREEFWWQLNADGSIQGQGNTDCESNFGKAQQALTYTGKYLDEFNITFATNAADYHYRASFSIGVQTPGEYYKDETSPKNVITVTTNPNDSTIIGIDTFEVKGAAIEGGSATCKVVATKTTPSMIYWNVKVYNNTLYIAGNDFSYEFKLNDNYIGGYFSIISPNSYTKYYPTTINTIIDSDSEYKLYSYSPNQLKTDGWVATKNNGGTITTYDDNIYKTGTSFYWSCRMAALGARIKGEGKDDCEDNFGKAYQNLTYTGKEYKNVNLKFKTDASGWHCGIAFSIGVKNAGEIYLDSNSPSNVITAKTNFVANGDITQLTVSGAAVEGGSKTLSIKKDSNNLFNWDVTVRGNKLYITCNSSTMELNLNDNYVGGYVQLSLPNSYSSFYPITVKEIEYDENEYFISLNSLSDLEADGWKASFSSDPSGGEPFVDCEVTDYLLNPASGGIQRNANSFDLRYDRGYNNWRDPFYYMSALTYTGQQYKYFTLSVDYRLLDPTVPWPIVSFGQQSATAEMFYNPINDNPNPAGGETPIGVYPELEGSINIKGKNVSATRKASTEFSDRSEWHTLTITVTPAKVDVSIDDGVVTHSTALSSSYSGGYVSLMLGHSYSMFKNFKIKSIDDEFIGDVNHDNEINSLDLIVITQVLLGVVENSGNSDVNGDTFVDVRDLVALKEILVNAEYESALASKLMEAGLLYPLGRTMVYENAVEMDHVNTGFVFKGVLEGDVKADFTTNRVGSLLNVSVDGGENKVIEMSLDGLTTLAEDLEKGEHTIEVISGTSTRYSTTPDTSDGTRAYDGTLKLNRLYYSGTPLTYESDKASRILFIGDSITCGMGLDTSVESGYKASNSYYTYASVLGRLLDAEVEVIARCGAKVCHFAWADCGATNNQGRGKGLCNGINWLKSINVRNNTEYDYSNNQPDLIVINLGTNDIPYEKDEDGNWVDIWDDTNGNKYNEDVTSLLNAVSKVYPNSKIIWTVGMMDRNTDISNEYIDYFKSYVETWSAENNDAAYFLDLSDFADRTGHSGHPTITGHAKAAEELYDFILEKNIGINISNLAELNSVQKKK